MHRSTKSRIVFAFAQTVSIICILLVLLAQPIQALAQVLVLSFDTEDPAPQQSTTGPTPPVEVLRHDAQKPAENGLYTLSENVLNVPAYLWRHGCGPTAVGMVVGYYDGNGFPDLIPGSAAMQTDAVNQAIASGGILGGPYPAGQERHLEDYALPRDDIVPSMIKDDYLTKGRAAHIDDSIADFMDTSKSTRNNRYGWSWSYDITPAFIDYVRMMNPGYQVTTQQYYNTDLNWAVLTSEIDAGRPMVFLVDTDGNGGTDHFVPVIGYRTSPSNQYASWDTWGTTIRWENFRHISGGVPWGIWGGWSFNISIPQPEMDVRYNLNSVAIADGDNTPSAAKGTDFGSADVTSGTVSRVLDIRNTGTADLQLTGSPRVAISGANAADFTVTAQPGSPIGPWGNSTTFEVAFNPSGEGLRTAEISISNNDGDESPYNFSLQGTGTAVSLQPPSNVQATDGTFTNQVCVSWDPDGGFGHIISRADSLDGLMTILNPSDLPSLEFCDTTVRPDQAYYYWVQSCSDHSTCSPYSSSDTGYSSLYNVFFPAIVK